MSFDKRNGGIDEYAVQLIRYKSGQLAGKAGFRVSDRDDLEQELVFDLWRRLPRYDSARARRNTFIARVVEHKIASLIEAQKAAMRDYRRCRWSLNDRIEEADGRSLEREETIDQDDYMLRTGTRSRPAACKTRPRRPSAEIAICRPPSGRCPVRDTSQIRSQAVQLVVARGGEMHILYPQGSSAYLVKRRV